MPWMQGMQVVGILSDETDPMVSVMKVEKAPQESYADVGGLEQQIQVGCSRKVDYRLGMLLETDLFSPGRCALGCLAPICKGTAFGRSHPFGRPHQADHHGAAGTCFPSVTSFTTLLIN